MTVLLGLDIGTTSFKALACSPDGVLLASAREEYTLLTPRADIAELDAETYWSACCRALRRLLGSGAFAPGEIAALSISSQGETLIPVDGRGQPLRRAIVWLDNRAVEEAAQIEAAFGAERLFQVSGQPAVVPTWPACKLLWLQRHEPQVFHAAAKFLLAEEYLIYRLTGRYVAELSMQTSSLVMDIQARAWWQPMLDLLQLTPGHFGQVLEPGEPLGGLSREAAAETGLPSGLLVVSGAMDQAAGAIGAGCIQPGVVGVTIGGSLALAASLPGFLLDPERRIATYYHALPGRYLMLPFCQVGGLALRWWRDAFCQAELAAAEESGADAYDLLTAQAAQAPPGCNGLLFLPHLMGAASPEFDPAARGVFYGLSLGHQKPHFIRAIMESVAFMLKKNLDILESICGPVREVRAMGGGSRSPLWRSIMASVFDRPVVQVAGGEASALGAAILAGAAAGVFSSVEEGAERMVRLAGRSEPQPSESLTYANAYQEYLELYQALAPQFQRSLARQNNGNGLSQVTSPA